MKYSIFIILICFVFPCCNSTNQEDTATNSFRVSLGNGYYIRGLLNTSFKQRSDTLLPDQDSEESILTGLRFCHNGDHGTLLISFDNVNFFDCEKEDFNSLLKSITDYHRFYDTVIEKGIITIRDRKFIRISYEPKKSFYAFQSPAYRRNGIDYLTCGGQKKIRFDFQNIDDSTARSILKTVSITYEK